MDAGELTIKIKADGNVTVEESNGGIKSHKAISPDEFLKCIKHSLKRGGIESGLLPSNCISFTAQDDGSRETCILHPEKTADITFMNTEYKNFPLPRMVFGIKTTAEGRVSSCRVAIMELNGKPARPKTKLYKWPFSNVSGTHLCLGNNPLPRHKSLHTLGSVPYLILSMPNNLDNFHASNNRMGLEMRELLELLKDKCQAYYYDENLLIPSGMELGDFLSNKNII